MPSALDHEYIGNCGEACREILLMSLENKSLARLAMSVARYHPLDTSLYIVSQLKPSFGIAIFDASASIL